MDWLGEDFELMALGRGRDRADPPVAAWPEKEQDFAERQQGANLDGGIDAVHVGHDDVRNEHVGFESFCCFDCLFATIDGGCLKSALIEDDGKSIGDYTLIICD